jgi:hypothetical protein
MFESVKLSVKIQRRPEHNMKKLLLAAVSFAVFTLNGLDRVQLVGVIAFSAGVFAGRFRSGENQEPLSSVIAHQQSDCRN